MTFKLRSARACQVPNLNSGDGGRAVRFELWRQLHTDSRATVRHYHLADANGSSQLQYVACDLPASQIDSYSLRRECASALGIPFTATQDAMPRIAGTSGSGIAGRSDIGAMDVGRCESLPLLETTADKIAFDHACVPYRAANFSAEIRAAGKAGELRVTSRLSQEAYLSHAMRHRFCVVAGGDTPSTRKLGETIAVAAAGGCIPLYVASPGVPHNFVLPHGGEFDLCEIAFVVSLASITAMGGMRRLLDALWAIPAAEAARRQSAARAMRDAWVYREGSSVEKPSAAEHVVAQMCNRAHRLRWMRKLRRQAGRGCVDAWEPLRLAPTNATCGPARVVPSRATRHDTP